METLLHFLYVEDNPQDAELVRATLEADNLPCTITRVETPDAFITALTSGSFHLVLSDFSLPHFNGLDVLRLLRERHFDIPFIVVSGTIGEQLAVELLKNGATDYILKDQLAKLSPAIKRALVEYDEHTKLKQATEDLKQREALLQEAQRIAHIGNWVWNPGTNVIILSAELYNIFGLLPEQENLTYEAFSSRIFPADLSYVQSSINTST
ncbi:MAG: response regulator, partial [Bacteroidetes bacterium]